jgi:hypothetical protein
MSSKITERKLHKQKLVSFKITGQLRKKLQPTKMCSGLNLNGIAAAAAAAGQ